MTEQAAVADNKKEPTMSLTSQQQRLLFESAFSITNPQPLTQSIEEGIDLNEIEPIVMEYINNAIGGMINESTEQEELEYQIAEAVENLNTLCYLVNEYFGYNG